MLVLSFALAGIGQLYAESEIHPDLQGEELIDQLRTDFYPEIILGYRDARRAMFSKIDNVEGKVRLVYTGEQFRTTSIPDGNLANCEHTWPQSLFRGTPSQGKIKADIYHLYPTKSQVNGARGNKPFGEIPGWIKQWRLSSFSQTLLSGV